MKKVYKHNKLWVFLVGFFLVAYLTIGIQKYNRFETGEDLAHSAQPVWHLSRLEAPYSSVLQSLSFNDHFDPILLLFAPFYRLWPDARVLIIFQQIIVVLGVIPVYLYSTRKIKGKFIPLCISFLYLYFIGIQSAISSDYHSATISATFLGLAIYFFETKKWKYYWPTFILALFSREDVAIYLFGLSLYGFFIKKERKVSLITAIISITYYYLIYNFFLPLFNGEAVFARNSFGTKGTPNMIIKTFLTSPLEFLKDFIYPLVKLRNILLTSFSFGFLPFFSPLYWLMAPFTFLRHFANDAVRYSLQRHYAATLTPILAFSAVQVLQKIKFKPLIYLSILMAIVGTFYTNRPGLDPYYPAPPLALIFKRSFYVLPPRNDDYYKMMQLIPENASVSAQVPLLAHLINRNQIYKFPNNYQEADYIVLTFTESFYPMTYEDMESLKNSLLNDNNYKKLYLSYAGVLLKRIK
ncbi:MAG: DUF2079 domain-containing protein [Candidatus Beckwithbacteria bacterium]|nr:DUF2079 domain-containing protein [Candidatus Beckwithbacteria bacterium]